MRIVPELTSSNPAIIRSVVLFPHPEGPTSTTNSPSAMLRLTPSTARTPRGKTFVSLSSWISAIRNAIQRPAEKISSASHPLEHRGDDLVVRRVERPLNLQPGRPRVAAPAELFGEASDVHLPLAPQA